jgi:hypothetical protein
LGLLQAFDAFAGEAYALTYKSFRDQYGMHIAHRRLFSLRPKLSETSGTRLVLLSPEVAKLLLGPWPDTPMGFRCARLRAEFEGFLQGDPLVVCWRPFKGRTHHQLGRLSPVEHGVWDLRSVDPRPGLRVFFCLGARDMMVALTCSPRSVEVDWLSRAPLGPRDGPEWKRAIRDCRSMWSELFPGQSPLVGAKVDECFSNAKTI